ncbi:TetR/AcrR family transcriptional regulator [Bartonella sp. HY329]|uniref:TetR/AcrR family transcriptional regulator n=1 Tax=unclassified Bartonella TaxID=2645622 RepID=UPI0021C9BC65|nr:MULTISPECIES: TetR/AcrR family transcriptional regulator [unclassified Bartonella]UXM94102.1 TetR/AcrR family transcriptional regulator [Bartonella sp. HY329]UXN08424.1 TetR/AcrR family transcriptional regulator [Bartonella sp. HY328]
MPRVSKDKMIQNRTRIEETTAKLIKEKGLKVSIADLMNASGLTHGGFYKHYSSKDELLTKICSLMFNASNEKWQKKVKDAPSHALARQVILEGYLSQQNKNNVAEGCPIPCLAMDISRHDTSEMIKNSFKQGIEQLLAILTTLEDTDTAEDDAIYDLSVMVGALLLARATSGELSNRFLSTAKSKLIADR